MTECTLWWGASRTKPMAKGSDGYGIVTKADVPEAERHTVGRGMMLAHRWTWQRAHGPIPSGMFVCHRCDNPPCVNLDHLFLATPAENTADMVRKGRQWKPGRGATCRKGHPKQMYGGRWQCAECHRESRRRNRRLEAAA